MTDLSSPIIPSKRSTVWLYRIFNLNSFVIICSLLIIILAEIRFDFTEKMLGNYLKWNNSERKKLGRMWNVEQQNVVAMGQLNELLVEKEEKQEIIEKIESFRELLDRLKADRLITLTKEQFVKIYSRLPLAISSKIIDPYNLINYFHRSDWSKTFVFQKKTGIEIVLVNGRYGMLKNILISEKDVNYLVNFGKTVETSLENLEELSNRIYDIREFMDALYKMSRDERNMIIYNPVNLLSWENRLKRVGISETSEDNLVQIGFEIHSINKKEVVIFYIEDFLILSLMQHLTTDNKFDQPARNFQ